MERTTANKRTVPMATEIHTTLETPGDVEMSSKKRDHTLVTHNLPTKLIYSVPIRLASLPRHDVQLYIIDYFKRDTAISKQSFSQYAILSDFRVYPRTLILYNLPFMESIACRDVMFPLRLVALQAYRPLCLSSTEDILSTDVALSSPLK